MLALFTILLIAGSYFCYRHTGSDLLPAMDEGGFIVDYTMPPGSSLKETNRVISHVEKILRDTPDVATTARRTGLQLGLAAVTEANQGDISVKLKPMAPFWSRLFGGASANERTRSGEQVIADVRAKITEAEPVLDVEFPQLLQDMIGDLTSAPQPVVIKLFSEDGELLRHWAPVEASAIKKIPGVVDVEDGIENTTSGTAFTFNIDPVIAARAGFTPQEVELDASAMLQGEPSTTPVVLNCSLLHDSRAIPALGAQDSRQHAENTDRQRDRQDRHHRFARHFDRDSRADRNHSRELAALGRT